MFKVARYKTNQSKRTRMRKFEAGHIILVDFLFYIIPAIRTI